MHPATLCVHAGSRPDPVSGAVGTPIHQATTFRLDEKTCAALAAGRGREVPIYTRYGNPSQWAVQEKLAALEGAESALVTASGMAAIAATLSSLLRAGDHVVTTRDLYGGTTALLEEVLPAWGVEASFVDPRDLGAIAAAVRPTTRVLYFEALSNPLLKLAPVEGLAALARRQGLDLVVDATFLTPLGLRPLERGADLVVHSATKYLSGHSDVVAGVVCGGRGKVDAVWRRMLLLGGCLDPHAAFLLERGLKTLHLRMERHHENAVAVARFLDGHRSVRRVLHPFLPDHPDHAAATRLLRRAGGVVTFFVEGGDAAALRLCAALRLPTTATSLGGVESLVSLPFNSSHLRLGAAERAEMGLEPGCVRLSVGVEDVRDLIVDLEQALDRIPSASPCPEGGPGA